MLRVVNILLSAVFVFVQLFPLASVQAEESTALTGLIISEVKVRNDTTDPFSFDEFIELYNASSEPILLSDYVLEYFNTTNPTVTQEPVQKPIDEWFLEVDSHFILAKQPSQITASKQSPFSSLTDTGGRLRLVDSEGTIVDEVAWTNAQVNVTSAGVYPPTIFQCTTTSAACISKSQSLSRLKDDTQTYLMDWALNTPTPLSTSLIEPEIPEEEVPTEPEENPEGPDEETPISDVTCEGIIISEVLPNPAGSDTGNEFIELFNPTNKLIHLDGCLLQTSANSKKFMLKDLSLGAGAYLALRDNVTGLTLPNTAGGTVWLLSPTEELQALTYAGGLADDVSWAVIENAWQPTYAPSPNAINIDMPVKPCAEGQERDLLTNRCQAIVTTAVATLTPCKPGQERNPETNRCRSIVLASTAKLVPCKEGQERNPETNRCRSVLSVNTLGDCPEGQERNPTTNRCRKAVDPSGALATVADVKAEPVVNNPKWWLAGVAIVIALGYAIFEWRRDIAQKLLKARDTILHR